MELKTITAGDGAIQLIIQCAMSGLSVLLRGPHGVGKSELFKSAANELGIGYISRDLALMEPPDLVGMPYTTADLRTRFAPPAFLPQEGRGLLVIEEMNRAPRYMTAPCLQLVLERVLNDYTLPAGWIPMAAINPHGADYHVDPLDPALLSRFVQIEIEADPVQWATWAMTADVHPKIIEFVQQSPGIFDPGETNPRAWTLLSRQLRVWEVSDLDCEMFCVAAAGLVGEAWAIAFQQFFFYGHAPLTAKAIVENYPALRIMFRGWTRKGQLDLVKASMSALKRYLGSQSHHDALICHPNKVQHVVCFVEDLPADLCQEMTEWFTRKGYDSFA